MSAIGLRRLVGLSGPGAEGAHQQAEYTPTETVVLLVAGLAFVDGLIHIGAAVDHFDEFPLYTLVFATLAAVQIAWAAAIVWRPSRRLLLFGCGFSLAVVALWAASRTVGVPIGPRPWVPEAVGVADMFETAGEIATAAAVLSVVLSSRLPLARLLIARLAPVLMLVLFLSVLYGAGAHAG
jgi:hypothetical protein